MIINMVGNGNDSSDGEYYVFSQTIPSQTSTTMFGDPNQDYTTYNSIWQLNFDITYPIQIAGQSFSTWGQFANAATDYYVTTDKQQRANVYYDKLTATKDVASGFNAFMIRPYPQGVGDIEDSVTFPEFKLMIFAKFN